MTNKNVSRHWRRPLRDKLPLDENHHLIHFLCSPGLGKGRGRLPLVFPWSGDLAWGHWGPASVQLMIGSVRTWKDQSECSLLLGYLVGLQVSLQWVPIRNRKVRYYSEKKWNKHHGPMDQHSHHQWWRTDLMCIKMWYSEKDTASLRWCSRDHSLSWISFTGRWSKIHPINHNMRWVWLWTSKWSVRKRQTRLRRLSSLKKTTDMLLSTIPALD